MVWWRSRRWRGLLELIDMLPQASRYHAAIMNDPEQAEILAEERERREASGKLEPWSPPLEEFDLHALLMRDIIQTLFSVRSAVIAAAGGKPGKTPEYPTPITEVDRIMKRREIAWANNLLAKYGFGKAFF